MTHRRCVLLVQLPIPPLGPQPIRGNVPLAAGYLKLFARNRGLEAFYDIDIFLPVLANTLGDQALVEAILARGPWLVGFSCYLWNIDRTLWICARIKERRPDVRIILGGPEITADNGWVLEQSCIDYAAIGEGEQTFADLLLALIHEDEPPVEIEGLAYRRGYGKKIVTGGLTPPARRREPLAKLDGISSPYLEGILDAADEEMLLLETIRGCVFKCKFCYYPKSYDSLYFVSREKIVANLRHAAERGAKEVVLLDPTLNQRKDFADFLRLLADHNPGRRFTYFGELRGEGITPEIARLLKEANFTEVEIGLQSIDPHAQELMDRKNNLKAFERGAKAMLDLGIKVKVDLIIGLPGDTPATIHHGMRYLRDGGLYTDVQVFNLSILPGTAFRQEAEQLGLQFQPRPPYYVLQTPTLRREEMYELMQEAQDVFEMEWDPLPPPVEPNEHHFATDEGSCRVIDLGDGPRTTEHDQTSQAFTLWLRSADFQRHRHEAVRHIEEILEANPFTTLQVLLEPLGDEAALTRSTMEALWAACQRRPSYLDRFYSLQPGKPIGAKRLVVLLPLRERRRLLQSDWLAEVGETAGIVWRGEGKSLEITAECEYVFA